jgi:hypothetical protein
MAQDAKMMEEGIPIFQGHFKVKSQGRQYSFAFAKGAQIILKMHTDKKEIDKANFGNSKGEVIWKTEDVENFSQTITIPYDDVYTIYVEGKGLWGREVYLEVLQKPGTEFSCNPAWTTQATYTTHNVSFRTDSALIHSPAIVTQKQLKLFDEYLYQNVEMYYEKTQILGQAGIHNSQAKGYSMSIDPNLVPRNGKLKGYCYSLSSTIGGAKHWVIADVTVSVGALFLSPAGSFAAHGAMAVVGPQPGNEPVQYFISDRKSDIEAVREIYSPHNDARKATNAGKKVIGNLVGKISDKAGDAVKGTRVKAWTEDDLSFDQKGKVTNMLIYTASPLENKWFIMANPEYTQAKNVKLRGSAIYYAPSYKMATAKQYQYNLQTMPVEKNVVATNRSVSYVSLGN